MIFRLFILWPFLLWKKRYFYIRNAKDEILMEPPARVTRVTVEHESSLDPENASAYNEQMNKNKKYINYSACGALLNANIQP